jgi:NifU-like protein
MPFYPDRIHEHFLNPRNVGEIEDAVAVGEASSFQCGARLRLSLKIDDELKIVDAKFKATGCGYLIASASALTETLKGLSTGRASTLPRHALTDWFEQFPQERLQCVRLCQEALLNALQNYHNSARAEWTGDEALICTCFGVSEKIIERVVCERAVHTVREVTRACNAGGGCGSCHPLILDIIEDYWRTIGAQCLGAESNT